MKNVWRTSASREVLNSLGALVWIKDTRNNIVQVSELVASTVGRSVEEIEGRRTRDLFPDEADAYFADDLEVIRTLRPKRRIIEPLQLASGERIWIRTDKTPTVDADGSVTGVVATCFDVSNEVRGEFDRACLAVELERAQHTIRAREEFVATTTLELRSPIMAMSLQLQRLQRCAARGSAPASESTEEQLKRTVRSLSGNVDMLARRVHALLGVSPRADGGFVLAKEKVDLGELVRRVLEQLAEPAALAHCPISFVESERTVGNWDPWKVEQIAVNLLTNALKYGAARPVEIRVRVVGRTGVLSVRDHGIGISAEDQGRIFHKFGRAAAAEAFTELGIGLFIAREIAKAHGGRISVESELGHGAEFIVELPLDAP